MPSVSKATYSLDPVSLERLGRLAQRWQVSKSEVIRRVLREVDEVDDAPSVGERLAALHSLQSSVKEKHVDLEKWKKTIRDARH